MSSLFEREGGAEAKPRSSDRQQAPIAQSVERLHGKEKVCGSIPHGGSVRTPAVEAGVLFVVLARWWR